MKISPLAPFFLVAAVSAFHATADVDTWERHRFPVAKRHWIADALQNTATRAERHWKAQAILETSAPHGDARLRWAESNNLQQVAALRPEVGPLSDSLPALRATLAQAGIRLILIDRPEDQQIRHFATGGFFEFWERLRKTLVAPSTTQQLWMDLPR